MSDSSMLSAAAASAAQPPTPSSSWHGWRNAPARWRLELERAQLALRTEPVRAAEAPKKEEAPRPAERPNAARQVAVPRAEADRPVRATPDAAEPRPSAAAGDDEAVASGTSGAADAPSEELPQAASALARTAVSRRSAAPPSTSRAPAFVRPVWPAMKIVAAGSGGAVQVSIRDASLAEARLQQLALRLRLQLRGSGHRLERLTINGHEVISEEVDPCQSPR